MIARRKIKKPPKLNLIPILDAIFIFIFFLLMSAQFIDIYEINSDAPSISTVKEKSKKKPLNLTLEVSKEEVSVLTGVEGKRVASYKIANLNELNKKLIQIKQQHPKERSAIIKPKEGVQYQNIVKIIDSTTSIAEEGLQVTALDQQNRRYQTNKLFDKIIFETQD